MATWQDLSAYVNRTYKVMDEEPNRVIKMGFMFDDDRSQLVFLWRQTLKGGSEEWVQIESPIGEFSDDRAAAVVRAAEHTVVGGIGCSGNYLTVRHALPLENFDPNELDRPLRLVTIAADEYEKQVFGGDVH